MAVAPQPLFVFDFDGTLTTEDTFVLFMKYYHGRARWYARMAPLTPTFLSYKLGRIDRHAVKRAVVEATFTGEPWARVEATGRRFADEVIPTLLRPAGVARFRERIAQSREGGPLTVICSASITPYLEAFAESYGSPPVIACELEVDAQGLCTGRLAKPNVWGRKKVESLLRRFRSTGVHIVEAYGDSAGDRALLEAADTGFWRPFRLT